jgi:hypothetical protein
LFIAEKSAELIEKHHQEFIKRALSVRALAADVPLTTASASITMCRLQKDIDCIIHVLKNWRVGVNNKVMDHCPERDSISKFQCANHNCAKYVKQNVLEAIVVPRSNTPCTVLRWCALMSGTETMVACACVRRGLGVIAKKKLLCNLPSCLHEKESDHSTSKGQQKTN